jgi:CheY-like chemotaxis protein
MARILVADDDRQVREKIRALLRAENVDIVMIGDGRAAIQAITKGDFDLVILDIFMPGIDGLESIRTLSKQRPDIPIIAISGLIFPETSIGPPDFLRMAAKLGAAGTLRKPFRPNDLLMTISSCLGARR